MPTQQDIYAHMERCLRRMHTGYIGVTTEAFLVVDAASRWPRAVGSDLAPIAADVCRAEKDRRAEQHGTGDEWMGDDERASLGDDTGLDSAGGEL